MRLFKRLAVVIALLACNFFSATARVADTPKDLTYVSISIPDLQRGMEKNKNNVVGMVQLLRRADEQKAGDIAFDYLKRMRLREPNNAVVQAAYCFTCEYERQESRGDYRIRPRTAAEYEAFDVSLRRAYKLAPRMWLTYVVDANHKLYGQAYVNSQENIRSVILLQKAVRLAPRLSLPRYQLARAYTLLGVRGDRYRHEEAVRELKTAIFLQPALAAAAGVILDTREAWARDPKEAKWAAQQIVRLLAPGSRVGPNTRKRLEKYGVVVPWKTAP